MNSLNLERLKKLFGEDCVYEFTEKELQTYSNMSNEIINLLVNVGLPYSAAPEFQFENTFEVFDGTHFIIGDGIDFHPIVLNGKSGAILESLGNKKLRMINKTLRAFLLILIKYAEMVEKSLEVNGSKSYLENNIPNDLIESFRGYINKLEPESLTNDSFWQIEINRLLSHVED
jgi:hypothetical protein